MKILLYLFSLFLQVVLTAVSVAFKLDKKKILHLDYTWLTVAINCL